MHSMDHALTSGAARPVFSLAARRTRYNVWTGPHGALMGEDRHEDRRAEAAQWIAAISARQDRAAFIALFNFYAPRIKALMMRLGGAADFAEEIAQETLMTVWRKAAYFDPAKANASAWIFAIARNMRIDRLRRQIVAAKYELNSDFDGDPPDQPDASLSAAELDRRVADAMTLLSEEQIRVIKLSFFEGVPHEGIARTLGIPLGTVKSRLRLAMGHLRKLLSDFK
jgi:RNA polymerase sigma-70 factor, ECF subfamily